MASIPTTLGKLALNAMKRDAKEAELKALRKDVTRRVSLANKRLRRLEKNNLKDSPAYKAVITNEGEARFSVKGKSNRQIQQLSYRLDKFINAATSSVKGVQKQAKEIAAITGIKYKNWKDLSEKLPKFFELASKVEQYMDAVYNTGAAINYRQVWSQVNEYVTKEKKDLSDAEFDIDGAIESVAKALKVIADDGPQTQQSTKFKWFKGNKK